MMESKPCSPPYNPGWPGWINLSPFHAWCAQTLPTVFSESMSYYEDLCKLTEIVNSLLHNTNLTASQQKQIEQKFNELKGYVENYFTNLDVQSEINIKLDGMVEDGSLLNLIIPFLSNIQSALIVDSVEDMREPKRFYILKSNGHVYQYADGAFTDTGFVWGQPKNLYTSNLYDGNDTLLANINKIGTYALVSAKTSQMTDLPDGFAGRTLTLINISGFANNVWIIQILLSTSTMTAPHIRTINESGVAGTWMKGYGISEGSTFINYIGSGNLLSNITQPGSANIAGNVSQSMQDIPDYYKGKAINLYNIPSFNGLFTTQIIWSTADYFSPSIRYISANTASPWINIGGVNKYKTLNTYGDSFTTGDFNGVVPPRITYGNYNGKEAIWPYLIGTWNQIMVNNKAVRGERIGGTNGFANTKLNTLEGDYITLAWGINDLPDHQNTPLGALSDTTYETFYGAWNVVLKYVTENLPGSHVGVIVMNGISPNYRNYANAIIETAKKYGVPYYNLNYGDYAPILNRTGKNISDTERAAKDNYFNVSRTNNHPNALAHEYMAKVLWEWIKTI